CFGRSEMAVRIAVVTGYFLVLLGIGWAARRRSRPGLTDYFVASRTTPSIILFLTMAATNFSAFTVFGFAGAGWESGYAFYPIMAFGTGFMALTFVLIGRPVQRLGKEYGLITPPELVFHLTGSPGLRLLFFVVMTVFTLPYLAMQPMAAGYALQSLLGIPYFAGAALITGIMLVYTFLGGFRGVSWTDALQGGMMITLLLVAVALIADKFGGLSAANQAVALTHPDLFARPGLGGLYSPGIWFGYMALWFLCDPMFPQLFQRFYAARDSRALTTTMSLYPLLTGFLFLLPITIGVLGRATYPQLPAGTSADQILPLMLSQHVPPVIEALVLTAALAALMSTLDSQLLTLSSMFVRDVCEPIRDRFANNEKPMPAWVGKAFVVGLALIGLAIAYRPPATFRVIATQTFTGLAVLFPTIIASLYWKRMTAWAGITSILVGESLVLAYYFKLLPTFGTLPVVPIVLVSSAVLILVGLIPGQRRKASTMRHPQALTPWARAGWAAAFAVLFFVGHDVWNWGDARTSFLGYPWWIWMFVGLCVVTSAVFWVFGRVLNKRSPQSAATVEETAT
ncbi:sodium:solute symporter family protein, partial [Candidatus Bipolaricaulota bacterium]|nr:sodium:solute symporter family protein [Candidatus Bipolaricaulota bacterium]